VAAEKRGPEVHGSQVAVSGSNVLVFPVISTKNRELGTSARTRLFNILPDPARR
jgi:hypothetical protein